MAVKVSAENALGQVLICLRMSKLNFVAKETPYSAYVTIRKKFVKHVEEEFTDSENIQPMSENVKAVEIVSNLEQKVKDLSQKCGILEFKRKILKSSLKLWRMLRLQWMIG